MKQGSASLSTLCSGRLSKTAAAFGMAMVFAGASPASGPAAEKWSDGLQTPGRRVAAVRAFATGITRRDAEAIDVGWSGRTGWNMAVARAIREASQVRDPLSFGLVFRRLYAAYPSLHSHLDLRRDLDIRAVYGAPYLPFTLKADRVGPGLVPRRLFVASAATTASGMQGGPISAGDEVVAINGRPISEWLSRSPGVCRRNSLWQCYDDFDAQLRNELLGWDRRKALTLELLRQGERVHFRYSPTPSATSQTPHVRTSCVEDHVAYQGYEPIYSGFNLCVFGRKGDRSTEIWRLKSFSYPDAGTITSVRAEVDRFWSAHWAAASGSVRKLFIDVSGNGGGDVPMPWYALIFDKPFQEQYAQYLRLAEYDDPAILAQEIDDPAHARWFEVLRRTRPELWRRVGSYLPPVPQFCSPTDTRCEGLKFRPKPHQFSGTVGLIVDDNCVSSCSGFTWNILHVLGRRASAFGMPDSGDSNFKRAPLELRFNDARWNAAVGRVPVDDKAVLVTANVMVSRTTTAGGEILSGQSNRVARIFERRWNESVGQWANRVLAAAQ